MHNKNIFYEKKGYGRLLSWVIYLVIVAIILLVLLRFIGSRASNDSIKEQALAKQAALLIDSARPGTQIAVNIGNFIVSSNENKIYARVNQESKGYAYDFFTDNKPVIEHNGGILNIKIE